MVDLDSVGGIPRVMRELLDAGLLHGDCMTVTGKTVAENLEGVKPLAPGDVRARKILYPVSNPLSPAGNHMVSDSECAKRRQWTVNIALPLIGHPARKYGRGVCCAEAEREDLRQVRWSGNVL